MNLIIEKLKNISDEEKQKLKRITTILYTQKNSSITMGMKPISTIDDLYNLLEYDKRELIRLINILKGEKIIERSNSSLRHVKQY